MYSFKTEARLKTPTEEGLPHDPSEKMEATEARPTLTT